MPLYRGSRRLILRRNTPAVSGTPFSIAYIGNATDVTATGTYTFTSQNIGTADATRIVVVAIAAQAGSGFSVSSVTIAGNTATHAPSSGAQSTTGSGSDIWYLAVPTGTAATIVVTWSAPITRMAISIYNVFGSTAAFSSAANAVSSSNVNTLAQSATIPAGGGAITVTALHTSTPGSITPTNLANDTSVAFGNSTTVPGKNTSSSGSTSMGQSWAGSATDVALSIATFGP